MRNNALKLNKQTKYFISFLYYNTKYRVGIKLCDKIVIYLFVSTTLRLRI